MRLLVGLLILMAASCQAALSNDRAIIAIPTPTPGHMQPIDGRVNAPRAAGYAMARDEPTATNVADWLKRQRPDQVQALVSDGSAFMLENGTRVRILEADGSLARVQVMDGPHVNRSGWLPVNVVST
jgi:hypothetical protein